MPECAANRLHRLSWLHGIDIYEANFKNHVFGRHAHETFSIGAIVEGVGGYYCRGTHHVFPPGSLSLLNPEEVHTGHAVDSRLRYNMVYVAESAILAMLGIKEIRGFREISPSEKSYTILRSFRYLARALHEIDGHPGWRLQIEEIMHHIVRTAFDQFGGAFIAGPGNEPHAVKYLCDHIEAQLDTDRAGNLSITEIAARLDLHPNYLIQSFSKAKGISPYAYYLYRKIDLAKSLIVDGNTPLHAGLRLGFYDQAHFTRHFRKICGVTPGNFVVHL